MTGLEEWLDQHLPPPDSLDALAIFTDTRPLDQIGAWKHRERLWCHRFSRVGPCNERWQRLFVPLTTDTGLAEVRCTWGGVFVAEAIAAMRPGCLSDTDVAPTAFFEIEELVRLCAKTCHSTLETCTPGIIVGTEPYQDINAGLVIFPGTCTPAQPGCLRRRVMPAGTCLSGNACGAGPTHLHRPPHSVTSRSSASPLHSRMPSTIAWQPSDGRPWSPRDYLTAWARATTSSQTANPTSAPGPEAASSRAHYARPSKLSPCPVMPSSSVSVCTPPRAVLPLIIHYYGNKDAVHELDAITYLPYLAQALFGHGTFPPYWCLHEWKVPSDFAVECRQLAMLEWAAQQSHKPQSQQLRPHPAVLPMASHIADGMPVSLYGGEITDAQIGGEVIHVYGTGLNAVACPVTCPPTTRVLPMLDEPGHQQWVTILRELGFTNPEQWVVYAAQYANLAPPSTPRPPCTCLALCRRNSSLLMPTHPPPYPGATHGLANVGLRAPYADSHPLLCVSDWLSE